MPLADHSPRSRAGEGEWCVCACCEHIRRGTEADVVPRELAGVRCRTSTAIVDRSAFDRDIDWCYAGSDAALERQLARDLPRSHVFVDGARCAVRAPDDVPRRWRPYLCQAVMGFALELVYRSQGWQCVVHEGACAEPLRIRVVTDGNGTLLHYQADKRLFVCTFGRGACKDVRVILEASDASNVVCISYVFGDGTAPCRTCVAGGRLG